MIMEMMFARTARNMLRIVMMFVILNMCRETMADIDANETFIDYRFQNLTSFATSLPLLETLRLPNNRIRMIEKRAFQHNPNMQVLDLRQNKLTTLPSTILVGLSKMKQLDLSDNRDLAPQKDQPFLESNSLKVLKCNNCGFSTTEVITFSKLYNLEELHLAGNMLLVAPCLLPFPAPLRKNPMKIITDCKRCMKRKFLPDNN